jgi:hypothetical protein
MKEYQCHIWLGLFGPGAPKSYFVQEFGEDDDMLLSQFGVEQEQPYSFDNDFVEISFVDDSQPVRDFVDGHSYSESYLDAVAQKAAEAGIAETNVFVLANKDQFESPRSVSGPDYKLWYLGEFTCRT